eukprot:CAMPEP_0180047542 /NCGR_PEP_ID=MMETSP0984-20121128/37809_1 /TAXON_ID=483367 /ORGANISM="non described non described, Strain CCMP 2436" /LENGTH=184 /DNA_ID=CAMNT_0021976377 /DNA_START=120 /DNA_END=672 /DNA_ORIENTATION=+
MDIQGSSRSWTPAGAPGCAAMLRGGAHLHELAEHCAQSRVEGREASEALLDRGEEKVCVRLEEAPRVTRGELGDVPLELSDARFFLVRVRVGVEEDELDVVDAAPHLEEDEDLDDAPEAAQVGGDRLAPVYCAEVAPPVADRQPLRAGVVRPTMAQKRVHLIELRRSRQSQEELRVRQRVANVV